MAQAAQIRKVYNPNPTRLFGIEVSPLGPIIPGQPTQHAPVLIGSEQISTFISFPKIRTIVDSLVTDFNNHFRFRTIVLQNVRQKYLAGGLGFNPTVIKYDDVDILAQIPPLTNSGVYFRIISSGFAYPIILSIHNSFDEYDHQNRLINQMNEKVHLHYDRYSDNLAPANLKWNFNLSSDFRNFTVDYPEIGRDEIEQYEIDDFRFAGLVALCIFEQLSMITPPIIETERRLQNGNLELSYQKKYEKYKSKYLALKKQLEGKGMI